MADKRLQKLNTELGFAAPAELAVLTDAELAELASCLKQAKSAQKEQIRRAFDSALSHVPFLLRGPLKKMLGA